VILDGGIGPRDVVLADDLAPEAARQLLVIDTTGDTEAVRASIDEARRRAERAWVACAVFSPVRAWKNRPGLSALGREAVQTVLSRADESVLIVFSNPRIVREVQAPSRIVWTYGEDAASQRSAIAFLRGALPATGRLPIRV
jgi:hypothetical protein